MIDDRRAVRRVLRALALGFVAAAAVATPVGAAQAHSGGLSAQAASGLSASSQYQGDAATGGQGDATAAQGGAASDGAVRLDTVESGSLEAADIDLVKKVRQAGMWEEAAGRMAQTKGVNPRVRQIGKIIADQHLKIDALDIQVAKKVHITLPTQPTGEQQRWLDEMRNASGQEFDQIYAQRLRAAHGKIFASIAVVRAGTQNAVVRDFASQANTYVLGHITMLESTGDVSYAELPHVVAPATGPISNVARKSANGGISVPLIWVLLGVALITGMGATTKMIRPRAFGGRQAGQLRPGALRPVEEPAPVPRAFEPEYPYPRPRTRQRSSL